VHRINNSAVQNCTVSAENPYTEFLSASPKLHSLCREFVHRINNNTVQNCAVSAENPCTEFLIAQFKTAQFLQRILAQNSQ